jgi:hypothetical protein
VNGKTGTRHIPLIDSIPYIKDWISNHHPPQNHAQNMGPNDSSDANDTLHTLQGPCSDSDYPAVCYYCDYKPDNREHYEEHVVLKHDHCIAYPNKAEIEKRSLEPQGKDWEI